MPFEFQVQESISNINIEIEYKSPGSKWDIITYIAWFPPGYVITKNTVKRSPIDNTIVGAREKGCTRRRQYAIDKVKKPTQPAFGFA